MKKKPEAKIENGKFELHTDAEIYREEGMARRNIRTAEEMVDAAGNPDRYLDTCRQAGATEDEIATALYVLVWPTKKSGAGQWVMVRATSPRHSEVAALRDSRTPETAAKKKMTIHLSSRGWGDYSPLVWTGDAETPREQILAECQDLLANGHDVDTPAQTEQEILAKIADAQGAPARAANEELAEIDAQLAGVDRAKLPATEAEARAVERRYNDLHNEGGEGYVPHVMSQVEHDSLTARAETLQNKLAAKS